MHVYPPAEEESRDRLHRADWSVAEVGTAGGSWLETGTNGENRIDAAGGTPEEAWGRAYEQAAAVGMLAPESGEGPPRTATARRRECEMFKGASVASCSWGSSLRC
jgi:hypothetical protein